MSVNTPKLKYIKRAGCWCFTYLKDGKQKQKWITDERKAAKIDFFLQNTSPIIDDTNLQAFLEGLESG